MATLQDARQALEDAGFNTRPNNSISFLVVAKNLLNTDADDVLDTLDRSGFRNMFAVREGGSALIVTLKSEQLLSSKAAPEAALSLSEIQQALTRAGFRATESPAGITVSPKKLRGGEVVYSNDVLEALPQKYQDAYARRKLIIRSDMGSVWVAFPTEKAAPEAKAAGREMDVDEVVAILSRRPEYIVQRQGVGVFVGYAEEGDRDDYLDVNAVRAHLSGATNLSFGKMGKGVFIQAEKASGKAAPEVKSDGISTDAAILKLEGDGLTVRKTQHDQTSDTLTVWREGSLVRPREISELLGYPPNVTMRSEQAYLKVTIHRRPSHQKAAPEAGTPKWNVGDRVVVIGGHNATILSVFPRPEGHGTFYYRVKLEDTGRGRTVEEFNVLHAALPKKTGKAAAETKAAGQIADRDDLEKRLKAAGLDPEYSVYQNARDIHVSENYAPSEIEPMKAKIRTALSPATNYQMSAFYHISTGHWITVMLKPGAKAAETKADEQTPLALARHLMGQGYRATLQSDDSVLVQPHGSEVITTHELQRDLPPFDDSFAFTFRRVAGSQPTQWEFILKPRQPFGTKAAAYKLTMTAQEVYRKLKNAGFEVSQLGRDLFLVTLTNRKPEAREVLQALNWPENVQADNDSRGVLVKQFPPQAEAPAGKAVETKATYPAIILPELQTAADRLRAAGWAIHDMRQHPMDKYSMVVEIGDRPLLERPTFAQITSTLRGLPVKVYLAPYGFRVELMKEEAGKNVVTAQDIAEALDDAALYYERQKSTKGIAFMVDAPEMEDVLRALPLASNVAVKRTDDGFIVEVEPEVKAAVKNDAVGVFAGRLRKHGIRLTPRGSRQVFIEHPERELEAWDVEELMHGAPLQTSKWKVFFKEEEGGVLAEVVWRDVDDDMFHDPF